MFNYPITYIISLLMTGILLFNTTKETKDSTPNKSIQIQTYPELDIYYDYKNNIENEIKINFVTTTYGNKTYIIDENGYYHDLDGRIWKPIMVTTTAYTWKDDGVNHSIGAGDGKTAILKDAIRTYGIASGSPLIPIGSTIHVEGYGIHSVDDTGGALKRAWRMKKETVLDLRIPQLKYDGTWRSINACQYIARNHGRKTNRMVLILVN